MSGVAGEGDEYIQKTIFKHKKKKIRILDDNNISNIIIYENAKLGSIPPPIIRQTGYCSSLDTDESTRMETLSLITSNN
jgi:hypothetical protein